MKRLKIIVAGVTLGVLLSSVSSSTSTSRLSAETPPPFGRSNTPQGVTARPGECISSSFTDYIDGRTGASSPQEAVRRSYKRAGSLRQIRSENNVAILEEIEGVMRVGAYEVRDLGGPTGAVWVLTRVERSAPCDAHDHSRFSVPYSEEPPVPPGKPRDSNWKPGP